MSVLPSTDPPAHREQPTSSSRGSAPSTARAGAGCGARSIRSAPACASRVRVTSARSSAFTSAENRVDSRTVRAPFLAGCPASQGDRPAPGSPRAPRRRPDATLRVPPAAVQSHNPPPGPQRSVGGASHPAPHASPPLPRVPTSKRSFSRAGSARAPRPPSFPALAPIQESSASHLPRTAAPWYASHRGSPSRSARSSLPLPPRSGHSPVEGRV